MSEKISAFVGNFSTGLSKLLSKSPAQHFEERNSFWKKLIFRYFRTLSEKNGPFGENFSAVYWKLHSTCPKEHFEEKFSFLDIESKIFRPFGLFFLKVCENCILSSEWTFWRQLLFWKKKLVDFGHWAKNLSVDILLMELSKRLSTCLEQHFEETNVFYEKTIWFFNNLRTLSRKVSAVVEKFAAGLPKLHSTCPQEQFERNFLPEIIRFSYFFLTLSKKIWRFVKYFSMGLSSLYSLRP